MLLPVDELLHGLTCEDIIKAESAVKFTVEQLGTLEGDELNHCFPMLGQDKLSSKQAQVLWNQIKKVRGPPEEIPEEDLRQLGWITRAIPADNFLNMSFTDTDTVAAFSHYYELSYDQLSCLRAAVMWQWSYKEISDLSNFDLANLGHILCAFNISDIEMIRPDAYSEAANELSLLKNCSSDVIRALANLAVRGFGDPSKWTALQMSSIGCVIAGVPNIRSIPRDSFQGVTPDIVECLPSTVFQSMSEDQLRMLPASSAVVVAALGLSGRQKAAIKEAVSGPQSRSLTMQIIPERMLGGLLIASYCLI